MVSKLISAAVFSGMLGLTMLSSQAEARRLFWWEALPPERGGGYDVYGDGQDYQDGQDPYADDMFNQEQYDQYMSEMNHRRHRRIYDQSYYDPQVESPDNPMPAKPKPKVLKFKKPAVVKVVKTEPVIPAKPGQQASLPKIPKQAGPLVPVTSPPRKAAQGVETIADEAKAKTAAVTCAKGATIVTSYGFSTVTSKTCTGGTYVYGATRGGKNFEIQVSAVNGELTAVKKL